MITKIQSFTDVITNSSSTVFVMHEFHADYYKNNEEAAPYIEVEPITMEWLRLHPDEVEMVCSLLHVNPEEITTLHKADWGSYYNDPDPEAWEAFLNKHADKIKEVFEDGNLYWVDIEDHFCGAYDLIEDAHDYADWSENRH